MMVTQMMMKFSTDHLVLTNQACHSREGGNP